MRDAKISINESNLTSTIVSQSGKRKSLHDCVKVHELRSESLYASFSNFMSWSNEDKSLHESW